MHTRNRLAAIAMATALFASGCYGPFNLTRRLYQWNGQINGKWEKEFVFLVLAYVPVYGLTVFGDAVIFNSMEFWTGNNPVDPPGTMRRSALPQTKRIARGDAEAILSYRPTPQGASVVIQQFQHGQPAGRLTVQRRDGMTVGLDADGKVLLTAQTLADGRVLIRDSQGKQVASYSAGEVEQFLKSAPN